MLQRFVVTAAAWLEIVVGSSLLAAPDFPCQLLLAAKPSGLAIILARFAGVGLLSLGIACLPSKATGSSRRAVYGLLVFNFGVAILLAWVAVETTLRGILLWPAAVLHAGIAAALLPQLLTFKIIGVGDNEDKRAVKVAD